MLKFFVSFVLACAVVFVLLAGGLKLAGYYEPAERELVVQPVELLSDSHTLDLAELLRDDKDELAPPNIDDLPVLQVPTTNADAPTNGQPGDPSDTSP